MAQTQPDPDAVDKQPSESAQNGDGRFRIADLSRFHADPDKFFDFSYRQTLHDMVQAVIEAEAPVREDILAQRIARAHGWQRTGRRIRDQIAKHLREVDRTEESSGDFLWKKGTVASRVAYRPPAGPAHRRAVGEIAIAELSDVVEANLALLDEDDPPLVLARLIDVERLSASARARLEEAIERTRP
ncbi:DUF3320 domain-containing protein [Afifella aestuarii]|uniref:DUF3320 domain-containing protein n=1 Tax=Afifella aestuarii TaxID=1909496 RepID=UPI000FE2A62C|nr:DUF3320 domain-containing protein [Afifella aestuarii]